MRPPEHRQPIAALYVAPGSHYHLAPGVVSFDRFRDATTFAGNLPFIAHPTCRTWATCSRFSSADRHEQGHAILALAHALRMPAIIEHPLRSRLWRWTKRFPRFTHLDLLGSEWGGPTPKPTRLALAGVRPYALLCPPFPGHRPWARLTSLDADDPRRWLTPPALITAMLYDIRRSSYPGWAWQPGPANP